MEKTVYQRNISNFHKSLHLLISSILNNNNHYLLENYSRMQYISPNKVDCTVSLLVRFERVNGLKCDNNGLDVDRLAIRMKLMAA